MMPNRQPSCAMPMLTQAWQRNRTIHPQRRSGCEKCGLTAVQQGGYELHEALDTLPVPVYVTDADGVITYYNRACIRFAGRKPQVGQDNWCVTWKLYSEAGQFLPHDQCPMAVAVREKRAVRGVRAVAERPDGTRINFLPYPTPVFDPEGRLVR